VHLAPAFGADDMEVGRREGLPVVNPVDATGGSRPAPWEGQFVKDADPAIIADLQDRGLLLRRRPTPTPTRSAGAASGR
jgi:isoleucyl-tRNA synthetase